MQILQHTIFFTRNFLERKIILIIPSGLSITFSFLDGESATAALGGAAD
jgi:hypothetical protein